jgi:RNA polymerase sigma factor (sigma-70 family)
LKKIWAADFLSLRRLFPAQRSLTRAVSPPTSCDRDATAERTRWFDKEVHPHDTALKSYLRNSFPAIRDVDDIAQESYIRVWKQRASEPIRTAKAFLFKVAQHLALDALRRERRSPIESVGDSERMNVLENAPSAHDLLGRNEKTQLLIEAIDALPARCREVVILRKLKLVSQRETAAHLGISEKGVENQLARGLARCREFLQARGVNDFFHGS